MVVNKQTNVIAFPGSDSASEVEAVETTIVVIDQVKSFRRKIDISVPGNITAGYRDIASDNAFIAEVAARVLAGSEVIAVVDDAVMLKFDGTSPRTAMPGLTAMMQQFKTQGRPPHGVRIGISTGQVLTLCQSPGFVQYQGPGIDTAWRLAHVAQPHQILVDVASKSRIASGGETYGAMWTKKLVSVPFEVKGCELIWDRQRRGCIEYAVLGTEFKAYEEVLTELVEQHAWSDDFVVSDDDLASFEAYEVEELLQFLTQLGLPPGQFWRLRELYETSQELQHARYFQDGIETLVRDDVDIMDSRYTRMLERWRDYVAAAPANQRELGTKARLATQQFFEKVRKVRIAADVSIKDSDGRVHQTA